MSDNGHGTAIPFQAVGVPLVGQPFQLLEVGVPVNAKLSCACCPDQILEIVGSVPVTCPGCGKVFNARFNPTNGKLEFFIGLPAAQVPA